VRWQLKAHLSWRIRKGNEEENEMSRRAAVAVIAASAVLTLAACTSSGTHTQSYSPSPTHLQSSSTTSSSPGPTSSTPITASSAPKSTGVPTPSVTPSAQNAVNAYVADFNTGIQALRDPAHADLSWIAKYETGTFRTQDEQSFASLKSSHLAYRGAAPDPNIKVQSVLSPTAVILTSCQVVDPSNPWVQYDTTTGKAVPGGKPRTPPPPYLLQLFMKSAANSWQVSSVVQDTSKTCKG
jgi:hypothetical protein